MKLKREHLDQLSNQMEKKIKTQIYNLIVKSLDHEQAPGKMQKLINLAEMFQPGTKNMIKNMLHRDLIQQNKAPTSRKGGNSSNGFL
ncbi:MAG: hypothetical protein WB502_13225 [Thermoactinomyces sp.]